MNTIDHLNDQLMYQATHSPNATENKCRSLISTIERRALTRTYSPIEVIESTDEAIWALWLDANQDALWMADNREFDF